MPVGGREALWSSGMGGPREERKAGERSVESGSEEKEGRG
jgi:hypothetical protein